jgi:hypothetical protein
MHGPRSDLARLDDHALFELARLHLVECLTRGAAHALNNALTALGGMIDSGAELAAVEREVQRCNRIARALTAGHVLRAGGSGEADLPALVRQAARILRDTLGSRFELSLELHEESLYVEADPARVLLCVLALAFRLAELSARGGALRIAAGAGEKPDTALLELELRAPDLPAAAHASVLDPAAARDAGTAAALHAITSDAAACGAVLEAERAGDALRVLARLPAIAEAA